MQWRTCARIQPVDGCVQGTLTPCGPLFGGVRDACCNMRSSSCYTTHSAARRRRRPKLCSCLSACSSVVACSIARAPRRTATRCYPVREATLVFCAERGQRGFQVCKGCPLRMSRWEFTTTTPRGAHAFSRTFLRRRARKVERACRVRQARARSFSYGAIQQRRVRWLLARNQLQHAAPTRKGQEAEEPPLRAL
jgi:hypothetical protein